MSIMKRMATKKEIAELKGEDVIEEEIVYDRVAVTIAPSADRSKWQLVKVPYSSATGKVGTPEITTSEEGKDLCREMFLITASREILYRENDDLS